MDEEELADQEAAAEYAEDAEGEYDLQEVETEDLDDAMREALEAVERSQEHLAEAAAESAESGSDTARESNDDLSELEAELLELRNRSVRTLADFDNYRKRVARERSEERRYAAADLAQDILAVVDNLERALGSEGSAEDLKQGVGMIHRQLEATLGRHGVRRVTALGEPFDPTLHEAVMRVEEAEVEEPTVREELQSGYTLHERLLRPSMVKVA
ncbi:MAG: nucleotide exchange factor GrpE, partial [Thermoanaerobaculia bacterium]